MSGDMTTDAPAGASPPGSRASRRPFPVRAALVEGAVVVVVFAVVGAGAGWLWHRIWNPPLGTVIEGSWGYNDFRELGSAFSATGLYVVIGLIGGLVLGLLAGLLTRRSELVTLAAVAVGSALAAYLCYRIGVHLGPADPRSLAEGLPDGTTLPDHIAVPGRSPFVAWSLGGLVGLAAIYLTTTGVSAGVDEARRRDSDDPRWLSRNQNG